MRANGLACHRWNVSIITITIHAQTVVIVAIKAKSIMREELLLVVRQIL